MRYWEWIHTARERETVKKNAVHILYRVVDDDDDDDGNGVGGDGGSGNEEEKIKENKVVEEEQLMDSQRNSRGGHTHNSIEYANPK